VVGGEASSHEQCLDAITLFRTSPMWFRKLRSHRDPEARGGVAIAPRRSKKFGPRSVEALEERALMSMGMQMMSPPHHASSAQFYKQTNLVSDVAGLATHTDPDLINPWGIAHSSSSPWWVNDNGTGLATLYDGSGVKQGLKVTIPPPAGSPAGTTSTPTGIVFNPSTTDFGGAHFIFDTEDGTISAWTSGTSAVLEKDNSAKGAVYKGLALATVNGTGHLFATNFHDGTIEEYDNAFNRVTLPSGAFTDHHIPHSFAPFGIANINGDLFVTYAKQNAAKHDDVAGPRRGFVDEFDTSGHLIQRVATRGTLNSPWGLAMAPSNFGQFSSDLLVGNFGDGRINAFKPIGNGKFQFVDQLRDSKGQPITIDGLWSLAFGNGGAAGPTNTLFFSAGINGEADGLFGSLTASM
jgi:uncharacterized protein (TIGR03118 family)